VLISFSNPVHDSASNKIFLLLDPKNEAFLGTASKFLEVITNTIWMTVVFSVYDVTLADHLYAIVL
jgi:hypothetical protein